MYRVRFQKEKALILFYHSYFMGIIYETEPSKMLHKQCQKELIFVDFWIVFVTENFFSIRVSHNNFYTLIFIDWWYIQSFVRKRIVYIELLIILMFLWEEIWANHLSYENIYWRHTILSLFCLTQELFLKHKLRNIFQLYLTL